MTNANRPLPFHGSTRGTSAALAAGLLIVIGMAFQWAQTSYGHAAVDNLWYISLILKTVWRTAGFCLNAPELRDAFRFWPMALVAAGVAMLFSVKRAAGSGASGGE